MNRDDVDTTWHFKKTIATCLVIATFSMATLVYCLYYSKNSVVANIDLNTHHTLTHPIQVQSVTFPEAKTEIYPFMVFLYSTKSCAGTLFHIRFILTAAHCIYGVSDVLIVLGTKNLYKEEPSKVILDSNKFIIHEDYTETSYDNDIALIQLDDGDLVINNFINTISLISTYQEIDTQNKLFALGWGWDANTQSLGGRLLAKQVTAVDINQCYVYYQTEHFKYEESKILCTMDERGPCHGDSGGPLISNNIQIGVLSGGKNECEANTPVRYMNVGYYANWIQNKISDNRSNEEQYVIANIDLNTHHKLTHPIQVQSVTLSEAKTEIYPFMVFLLSNKSCAGTLIHIRFILTAAHCIYGVSDVHIMLGTKNLYKEEPSKVILDSNKFIIHEDYTEEGYDNDIALIQLDDGDLVINNFINTISLISTYQEIDTQNKLFALGWGWDANTQSLDGRLLAKQVTSVDINQCYLYYQTEHFKYEESKIFCTMDERGPCHGDSGGPLISNNIQIGVLSGGKNECEANTPVRYMNVGYYANWIQNKISDNRSNEEQYVIANIDLNTHHKLTHPIQVQSVTLSEAKTEIYPFMVFLLSSKSCAGTLIHIRFILTAAHCIYGVSDVRIMLGTNNSIKKKPSRQILADSNKFIIHEDYTEEGYDNDIALIQLDNGDLVTNFFINTISLSTNQKMDTQNKLFVLGWGWDANTQSLDGRLLAKQVTAVDSNQCYLYYQTEHFKYEESKIFCTMDERGPCHGDSGGPLISNNIQIGVLSGGKNKCEANTPVRYMNVGYYANWIQNKISDNRSNEEQLIIESSTVDYYNYDYLF